MVKSDVKNHNYLIVDLSLMGKQKEFYYEAGNGEGAYTGVQTNEAATKYVIDLLAKEGEQLEKVILLCSPQVREVIEGNQESTLDYYKRKIKEFWEQCDSTRDKEWRDFFDDIDYNAEENDTVSKILEPLERIIGIADEVNDSMPKRLFVDFSGGKRSEALMLVFACRILQNCGVKVEKILYSSVIREGSKIKDIIKEGKIYGAGKIEECTRTYHTFELLEQQVEQRYGYMEKTKENMEESLDEYEREIVNEIKRTLELS